MSAPTPIIIDCDPGIDDAVALALALVSREVAVRAVTTVAGNEPIAVTTRNALSLMMALGNMDVPVAAGATRALIRQGVHNKTSPHGPTGLGEVSLPVGGRRAHHLHAVDLMADLLRQSPLTVVAMGPLTNIALLLALHPDVTERISRLVVMGGSFLRGNITPAAEFNMWSDPEAARRVLVDSGLEIVMVGLDITTRATLSEKHLAQIASNSERGALLQEIVRGYGDRRPGGWPLHDALALATVIDSRIVETRSLTIEVDTGDGPGRGQTFQRVHAPTQGSPYVGVAGPEPTVVHYGAAVDVERFRSLLCCRLADMGSGSVPTRAHCPPEIGSDGR